LNEYILYPGHELCSYLSFFWEDRSSNDPGLSLFFDYIQDYSPQLRWFLEETTGRPRRFNHEDARAFCERQIRGSESSKESGGFAVAAYGSIEKKGVSPWTALAHFQVRTIGTHLLATWPLAESPTWDQLAMRLERIADSSLILAHGGLTYSYSVFRGHHSGARHAILPRYWGIDPPEPLEDAFAARNGCRSPSWLSYVPTEKLDRIPPKCSRGCPPNSSKRSSLMARSSDSARSPSWETRTAARQCRSTARSREPCAPSAEN
jgi:hypothetical protein